jgi:hypothetical protein
MALTQGHLVTANGPLRRVKGEGELSRVPKHFTEVRGGVTEQVSSAKKRLTGSHAPFPTRDRLS